ncbi:MAG: hypothetical protein U0V48_06825 [Anaerolineales bacterium]
MRTITSLRFCWTLRHSFNSDRQTAPVAYTDVTTGEFAVTELPSDLSAQIDSPASCRGVASIAKLCRTKSQVTSRPGHRGNSGPGKCTETLLTSLQLLQRWWTDRIEAEHISVRAQAGLLQYIKVSSPTR